MPLYTKDGNLLKVGSALATNSACCCASCSCDTTCNECSPALASAITATWTNLVISGGDTNQTASCSAIQSCVCIGGEDLNVNVTLSSVVLTLNLCCDTGEFAKYRGVSASLRQVTYQECYKETSGCCTYDIVCNWYMVGEYSYDCTGLAIPGPPYGWTFKARLIRVYTIECGQCTDNPFCVPLDCYDNTDAILDFSCTTTSFDDWYDTVQAIAGFAFGTMYSYGGNGSGISVPNYCECNLPLGTIGSNPDPLKVVLA